MPAPLQKLFAGSFFASVPGDNAAWVLLGLLEALVVVLLAVSLLRGEFLPQRRKPILLAGLSVSLLAFGVMGLANDMIGNNATVIELFTYFGVTIVAMFLIRQMSPYRPMSWLAGEMDD
jgi:Na+-transporting NADH:ubiquinone oxidoreductase subunit NqrB